MNLTPQQISKVEKVAKFIDDTNTALVDSFIQVEDRLDDLKECIDSMMSKPDMEMPEQIDYSEQLEEINKKIEEPQEIEVTLNII